jgi:hypothetical protein
MPKFKIRKYLPENYGPIPEQFSATGKGKYSEGFVVEFYPAASEKWVGNFQPGLCGYNDVIEHPNSIDIVVVAGGQAYVVNPETRTLLNTFGGVIHQIIAVPELKEIVFGDPWRFTAIGNEGLKWKTHDLAVDGMRDIRRIGTSLLGEASDLGDLWLPFSVDLTDGSVTGGYIERKS